MKLFGRSGGYWLFWITAIYFVVGMFDLFVYNFTKTEYIQAVWITVLSLPLFVPPLARWLNMESFWTMFKPFKFKTPVDEIIETIKERGPITPMNTEEKPKEPAYEIGQTEDNRVTLRLGGMYGSSTLTMNRNGVLQLIRMLEASIGPAEEEENA